MVHSNVVFCGKTYENIHKGQFHKTICELSHSLDPEKLCWYCNNLSETEYPTYICCRHHEYPDTDEEFPEREWNENDSEYIEVVQEQRDSCHSPPFNVDEMYLDYVAYQAEEEDAKTFDRIRWEADEEAYSATHCWYCDKACESEAEKKCHERYCKTRDHGYSDYEY